MLDINNDADQFFIINSYPETHSFRVLTVILRLLLVMFVLKLVAVMRIDSSVVLLHLYFYLYYYKHSLKFIIVSLQNVFINTAV